MKPTAHSQEREAHLLAACEASYVRGHGADNSIPYGLKEYEHDVALVLAGKFPEHCKGWSPNVGRLMPEEEQREHEVLDEAISRSSWEP